MKTVIMKFGGASLSNPSFFKKIASLIIERKKTAEGVVVVVSAMANMTDQLIELAKSVNSNPPQRELDMLVSIGERVSISLLSMALEAQGTSAISFTGSQSGIITTTHHNQAQIVDVRPYRLEEHLKLNKIVIIAGFQGVSLQKEITTLGRGGSDTSAVALAVALGVKEVEFYKDVGGLYDKDPKKHKDAKMFDRLSIEEVLKLALEDRFVLHPRCLKLAQNNGISLSVHSFEPKAILGTYIESNACMNASKVYECSI